MLYTLFGIYLIVGIFMFVVLIRRKMRIALAAYTAAFSVLLSFLVMYFCYDSMPTWGKLFVDTVGNFCSMMALLAVMASLFLALSSLSIAVTAIEAYRSRKTNYVKRGFSRSLVGRLCRCFAAVHDRRMCQILCRYNC